MEVEKSNRMSDVKTITKMQAVSRKRELINHQSTCVQKPQKKKKHNKTNQIQKPASSISQHQTSQNSRISQSQKNHLPLRNNLTKKYIYHLNFFSQCNYKENKISLFCLKILLIFKI